MSSPSASAPGAARAATVATFKFVGIGALGLLTGSSLTQSLHTPPALLALPSPSSASRAFSHLRASVFAQQSKLSMAAAGSLAGAFLLSPRGWRHPYLVWGWVTVVLTQWLCPSPGVTALRKASAAAVHGERGWDQKLSSVGDSATWDEIDAEEFGVGADADAVNGEAVSDRFKAWQALLRGRAIGYGFAWLVAVVGIWGDGAGFGGFGR